MSSLAANCPARPHRAGAWETDVNAVSTPKSLPWLARQAGVPDHLVEMQWAEALAMAGASPSHAVGARCQAVAMQYLLLMLGCSDQKDAVGAGILPTASRKVDCQ
jgi:hypothetical protein